MMGIYCIYNTVNDKVYIGSSLCIDGRFNQHKCGFLLGGKL